MQIGVDPVKQSNYSVNRMDSCLPIAAEYHLL